MLISWTKTFVGTTFFGNYALVGNTGINITDGGTAIIKVFYMV